MNIILNYNLGGLVAIRLSADLIKHQVIAIIIVLIGGLLSFFI
jgi:hypothetical protein